MSEGQGKSPDRRAVLVGLCLVLLAALGLRVLTYWELRDGPLLHLQAWTQSDMHFFDRWAKDVLAGDLLTSEGRRPYHGRHVNLACRALALSGAVGAEVDGNGGSNPQSDCSPEQVREIWDDWVGEGSLWQDPLYPYLLAGLYGTAGDSAVVLYAAHAAAGMLCVALVYLIALRLFDRRAAIAAGLLAAFFGPLLFYETTLLRAVPIAAVGLSACYALMLASEWESRGRRFSVCVAGILAGLLCLLKFSWLLTVLLWTASLVFARRHGGPRPMAEASLCYVGGVVVGMSPLLVRNAVLDQPLFRGAATGPLNFINSNAADRVAGKGSAISDFAAEILLATGGGFAAVAKATIATHDSFLNWLALLAAKAAMFFTVREIPNNVNYEYFLQYTSTVSTLSIGFTAMAALAIVGLRPLAASRGPRAPMLIYILTGIAVCVLFFNLSRFRLPIACVMLPLSGAGLTYFVDTVQRRQWSGFAVSLAAALGVVAAMSTVDAGEANDGIRIADYGVANQITVELARRATAVGERERAVALVLDQLEGEPEALRTIRPGPDATRISVHLSGVAGTFIDLHQFLADLQGDDSIIDADERAHHGRRAQVLRALNQPYVAAGFD